MFSMIINNFLSSMLLWIACSWIYHFSERHGTYFEFTRKIFFEVKVLKFLCTFVNCNCSFQFNSSYRRKISLPVQIIINWIFSELITLTFFMWLDASSRILLFLEKQMKMEIFFMFLAGEILTCRKARKYVLLSLAG